MSMLNPAQHKLLAALRAEHLIPKLYARLSMERYSADEDELRRMAAWPEALMREPGWPLLKSALEQPQAWPAVWHQATERGFRPETDHHHALLFGRLSARFVRDQDYEGAQWAWNESIRAWRRVLGDAEYIPALLRDLAPEADEPALQALALSQRELLVPLAQDRQAQLMQALRLEDEGEPSAAQLDRRLARFAWSALEMTRVILLGPDALGGQQDDSHAAPHDAPADALGALDALALASAQAQAQTRARALTRFTRMVQSVDLATARDEALLAPFEWAVAVFELVGVTPQVSVEVVHQIVETCWSLERLRQDQDRQELVHLLQRGDAFARHMEHHLDSPQLFGHNSTCADFLVFQAEQASDRAERRAILTRALKACPGHRNSALLMSHELLHEASLLLGQSQVRTLTAMRGDPALVQRAWHKVLEAEQLYPHNKSLEAYKLKVQEASQRLGLAYPPE